MSSLQMKALRVSALMLLIMLAVSAACLYFFVYQPLRANAMQSSETDLSNIVGQAEDVFSSIQEYVNYVAYGGDLQENIRRYVRDPSVENRYAIADYLNDMRNLRTGVFSLCVFVEGGAIPCLTGVDEAEEEMFASEWMQGVLTSRYGDDFSPGIPATERKGRRILYARNYYLGNHEVVIAASLDFSDWFGNVERSLASRFDAFCWMYDQETPLFSGSMPEAMEGLTEEVRIGANDARDGALFTDYVADGSYMLFAFSSEARLREMYAQYLLMIVLLVAALFLFSLICLFVITGRLTRPVVELSRAMSALIKNDLALRVEVNSDDEIGLLQSSFNVMSRELAAYVEERARQAVLERQMRFGLLISQIDPHFVCNTLSTINYMARRGKTDDVVVISNALSSILRDRLRLKDFRVFDTVEQELETIRQYLKIQNYRYCDHIHLEIDCPEELRRRSIPKNIIQPLVENSILHGLANEDMGIMDGHICIAISSVSGWIALRVSDDGVGIEPAVAEQLNKYARAHAAAQDSERGYGIGLHGVLQRLDILYGEHSYRYGIEQIKPHGTLVSIFLREGVTDEQADIFSANGRSLISHEDRTDHH